MNSTEEDRLAFDAFLLAVRVMYQAYEIEEPATEFEKPWSLLRDIAEGNVTITNPADMASQHPGMKEFIYERANQRVEEDRRVATRILRGLETAF